MITFFGRGKHITIKWEQGVRDQRMSLENMQYIAFISQFDGQMHLESYLRDMSKELLYNISPDDFTRTIDEICVSITRPDLKALFFRRLWAEYLLDPISAPWVRERLPAHDYPFIGVPELDPGISDAGSWVKIPVPVVRDDKARVAWFIAGLIPLSTPLLIPQWAEKIMDPEFRAGIYNAQHLVRSGVLSGRPNLSNRGFGVFPLAVANDMVQFRGGSGALGLSLGMKSLIENQPIAHKVIATGRLDFAGNVETVGFLDQKTACALEQKFTCVIHPVQTRSIQDESGRTFENKALYPVRRFDIAWIIATLYADTRADILHDFVLALKDAELFIDKMSRFPAAWLDLQRSAVGDLLSAIFRDMNQFKRFSGRFFAMTQKFSLHQTALRLTRLAPQSLPEQWPMAALTWCTANLALGNHLGQIEQARTWVQQGKKTAEKVIRLDTDLAAEFFNTLLVNAHNRFEFKTDLPRQLEDLLTLLEKRYGVMSESGCVIDQTLGQLYGTLVQNAAFCGPDHIKKTEEWSQKARKALGQDIAPELKPEWMRQYSYLGVARLCAKDMDGARECLCQYLGVKETKEIISKAHISLDPWQTAMLCRFLASGGVSVPDRFYSRLISYVKKTVQAGHPWQLTCFNLGRAAIIRNDKKNAVSLFELSRNICLTSSLGPAIEIMALKPLAFEESLLQPHEFASNIASWQAQIKAASRQLNPDHFFFLHDRDFHAALAYTRDNHDSIFPFSYG